MNAKERLYAVMEGREPDRLPNLNILMMFAAKEIGVKYRDYCLEPKLKVRGNIACAEKYGIDAVTVMSDPMTEAHDFGTKVFFPEDDVPYPEERLLADERVLAKLRVTKPEDGKRMSNVVEAIRLYKKELGDSYPVIGWVEGCFAEAADLRGVNGFLMDTFDKEQFLYDLLELCLEQAIMFAKAQIAAGADIIGVGDAIASVAGPGIYGELACDYERKLLRAIKEAGAKTKLHICGNTQPFLHLLPTEYIDILDVDWMVPLDEAVEKIPDTVVLSGNYDPVSVLMDMPVDGVKDAVRRCYDIAKNHKYATSAGCEVPRDTPGENLLCVNSAFE